MSKFDDYLMGKIDTSDPWVAYGLEKGWLGKKAEPAQQPRRKTFGFGEQKPVDTRTFQQYDPSNPVAQKQIGSSPVGVVLPNNPYREEAKEAVLKNVAQAMTDPMLGVTGEAKVAKAAPAKIEEMYSKMRDPKSKAMLERQYPELKGDILYRGVGNNLGFSAVEGPHQWWSTSKDIAARYGKVVESAVPANAKVLTLRRGDKLSKSGYHTLSKIAQENDIPFYSLKDAMNLSGEEIFNASLPEGRALLRAVREKGYDIIHTDNIEGQASLVLNQKMFQRGD